MKISFRALIAAALVTGFAVSLARAQDTPVVATPAAPQTNAVPGTETPPVAEKPKSPAKPKPASKTAAKSPVKKAAAKPQPKVEPVLNPEPGAAKQNNINVRGQATINSEIIAHLQKGQTVTILEEITHKKAKQDEPSQWYRIALPTNVSVWVHSAYIDAASKTVKPAKLNLRGGPGENYSVVGRLEKGTTVNQIESKGDWLKIETPTNAFGFVAAHLIEKTPVAIVAAPVPKTNEVASVPATTSPVATNTPPVIGEVATTTPVAPPSNPETPDVKPPPSTAAPVVVAPAETEPPAEAPIEKVKKIVTREGILKGSVSIQAPTYFELRSLDTGRTINYVFSPSTNLLLKEFKGMRIIVTGEELLDERWQNTPVITIDSLQTVP